MKAFVRLSVRFFRQLQGTLLKLFQAPRREDRYTREGVAQWELFAEQAQRRAGQLAMVNRISAAISNLQDLDGILYLIFEQVKDYIPLDVFFITLYDEQSKMVSFPIMYDNGKFWQEESKELNKESSLAKTLETGQPLLWNRSEKEMEQARSYAHRLGDTTRITASSITIPLEAGRRIIGTLSVQSYEMDAYNDEQLTVLMGLAPQATIAIQNARLFAALQKELEERKRSEREREAMYKDLEAKNAELEKFTYTVSHDLKSPLVTIGGFLGLLEGDIKKGDQQRIKSSMARIHEAATKMRRLLDELLELSRVGRLANPSANVAFDELAREAIGLAEGELTARQVEVRVEANLPVVHVDRVRMIEVLQNLIVNAIKFMGDQKNPLIEIGMRIADNRKTFFVKDNGMGIAPQFHERIFGLFNKLDQFSDGTGIGLALVRRIVEVHGGKIWVESELGKGATFFFTLADNHQQETL